MVKNPAARCRSLDMTEVKRSVRQSSEVVATFLEDSRQIRWLHQVQKGWRIW